MQAKYISLITICCGLVLTMPMDARGTKPAPKPMAKPAAATTAKTAQTTAAMTAAQQQQTLLMQQQNAAMRESQLAGEIDLQAQAAQANQPTDGSTTTPDTTDNGTTTP